MMALRWTTGVALVLTFTLIVLGAWVRATESGLSCPDWPTCYGHWLPLPGQIPPDAGYQYYQVMLEWAHRLIAGVILGPLVLIIALLGWRARGLQARMPAYVGVLILLLVVQGLLGGLTVLDGNSPWSVAVHLSTALLLFSVLWLIFERTGASQAGADGRSKVLAVGVWLLALAAMASAAMVAKTGSALVCSTWPLCEGAWVPDLGDEQLRLNFGHRALAGLTAVGTLILFAVTRREPALRGATYHALLLALAAVALGALMVLLELPVWSAVLHQAAGVLTFAFLSLAMWRCLGQPVVEGDLR
jgi:cytochrome c oxidase assembly protein subunit 15